MTLDTTALLIRSAETRDFGAYTELFAELEAPRVFTMPQAWETDERLRTLVAEIRGQVVGYLVWEASGHVCEVAVAPAWRRRRIGERLLRSAASLLRSRGLERWSINVKESNTGAIRLYERLGFRSIGCRFELLVPWNALKYMPRDRAPMKVVPVTPEQDGWHDEHLRFTPGRLQAFRREAPDNIVLALQRSKEVVGLCAFAPSIGRMEEFRVRGEAWAAPLLEGARHYRLKGDKAFVLELHAGALFKVVRRIGVETLLTVMDMRGTIPLETFDRA